MAALYLRRDDNAAIAKLRLTNSNLPATVGMDLQCCVTEFTVSGRVQGGLAASTHGMQLLFSVEFQAEQQQLSRIKQQQLSRIKQQQQLSRIK
jgi:hypothetical protein